MYYSLYSDARDLLSLSAEYGDEDTARRTA